MKAISFDFWNTIASSNPEFSRHRTKLLSEYSSLSEKEIINIFKYVKSRLDSDAEQSGIAHSSLLCVKSLIMALNIPLKNDTIIFQRMQQLATRYPPIIDDDLVSHIRFLKKEGIKIGIISNTNFICGKTIHKILKKHNLVFDVYNFSDEMLISKPSHQIFDIFSEKIQEYPVDITHIGDNLICDIDGARYAKFKTIFVENPKQTLEKVKKVYAQSILSTHI